MVKVGAQDIRGEEEGTGLVQHGEEERKGGLTALCSEYRGRV